MLTFLSPWNSKSRTRACVALGLVLTTLSASAQNNPTTTPTLTSSARDVNQAGYSLKPIGLAFDEWPGLRFDFSIEREDQSNFKNLSLNDVQVKVDGHSFTVGEDDLKLNETKGAAVMILLDGSGSMVGLGVDKLRAAKEALKLFVDGIGPKDRVGVIAFDEESRMVIPPTADKEVLKREIEAFTIRKDRSRFTRLYDAVEFGIREAKKNQIRNLLVISDGREDTPEIKDLGSVELAQFKERRERDLTKFSTNEGVRVFTIAIGDENGKGLSFVDRASLTNMSKGANGGEAVYIELTQVAGKSSLEQDLLLSRLDQTIAELKKSFGYSYSLTLRLDEGRQRSAGEHRVWMAFTVGDGPRVQLPVEYTYAFTATGTPVVTNMTKQPPIFIQSAPKTVRWQQLTLIYFALLTVLLVLAVIPAGVRRLVGGGKALRLQKAIMRVTSQSPLVGSVCPNEGTASGRQYLIKEGDVVLICPNPDCKTPHHLSCWRFNEHHCMQRNCELEMVVPPSVLEKYGLMERQIG